MRQLGFSALLLAAAASAFAQNYGIVDRAYSDLQRGASSSFYARHQRGHFDHALREISKFQEKWSRGKFDNHALDEAISEMSHLSRAGELNPAIRETLARDADEMRAFRAGGRYDRRNDGRYERGYDPYYRR